MVAFIFTSGYFIFCKFTLQKNYFTYHPNTTLKHVKYCESFFLKFCQVVYLQKV